MAAVVEDEKPEDSVAVKTVESLDAKVKTLIKLKVKNNTWL